MAESLAHRKAKWRSAGPGGMVEVPLPCGGRLDALSRNGVWGTEVELSGDFVRLMRAAKRLAESKAPQKVLKIPHRDMMRAAAALRRAGVSAWVRNMRGTEEFFVEVRR